MGFLSSVGGMVGGVVGGMFGGPIGAQIGKMLGGMIGQQLEQLMSQFGQQNVAGGLANCIQQDAANVANQHVDNCGLPKFIQDEMKQFIQDWMKENMQNVPSECQQGCNGVYGQATSQSQQSGDGDSCTRTQGDGHTNAAYSCAENEQDEDKSGSEGNWLVALAGSLAKVQQKFLTAAMENMDTMKENGSAAVSGGDKSAEEQEAQRNQFLEAQSQYQANMQMFNMVANMTATSLKSLGEGLTSIARKQ
ncbi:MAG: hypothetical protein JAY67_12825 [Candidatus Thiodiazotropha taylori]|nr:hypothetical protein [Candidatus Thiodiazotropha taylori]MCG7933212.1 hypothetical protein [Candidatus Thiodiazotropha taylori]